MHRTTAHRATSVAALLALAGVTRAEQNQPSPTTGSESQRVSAQRPDSMAGQPGAPWGDQRHAADYRSCHWMGGRAVTNRADESIGDAGDFVVERGSGQITHVVVKSGTTLGMGGRTVLVPFRDFQWDAAKARLVLMSSQDRLGQYPSYSEAEWKRLRTSTPPDRRMSDDAALDERRRSERAGDRGAVASQDVVRDSPRRSPGDAADEAGREQAAGSPTYAQNEAASLSDWMWSQSTRGDSDGYGGHWDASLKQRIEGEIKLVNRISSPHYGEQIVVEIATQDGQTKKVSLGPSWFISGSELALSRGERISVEVVPINIATSAQIGSRELTLRDADGAAAWFGRSFKAGDQTYAAPYYRSVLLSELRGARLDCRGSECGRVDDVVIEANSGTVAFLSIDPNQNFLGIADTKRLVPWTVATVAMDGRVRLDAGKEMVVASMETPSDITTLNTSGLDESVYKAYQMPTRRYDRWERDYDASNQGRGWSSANPQSR
jgi:sporulation protein YlmC with PRC-barrel domain